MKKVTKKPTQNLQSFDVYQMITDKILKQIETSGKLTWVKPWSTKGGYTNFPMNGKTKRRYDGVNFFLLQFSGYTSPYWLTYKQIEEMGGNVIKGEKSTQVVFWKINQYTNTNEVTGENETKKVPLLKYYNIFNVKQCENITIKDAVTPTPVSVEKYNDNLALEVCEAVINQYKQQQAGLKVVIHESDRAFYRPSSDLVTMPLLAQFNTSEEFYSTFFHELGHSTGHETRLNRKEVTSHTSQFGSSDYGVEELTAELTAAFLCAEIGISNETQERNSVAYLKHWMQAIKADKKMFIMASGRANKAAKLIMNKVEVETEETVEN